MTNQVPPNSLIFSDNVSAYEISMLLSIVGIVFILFSVLYLRLYMYPLAKMVAFISLADLLFTVPNIVLMYVPTITSSMCQVGLFISHYGMLNSFCWATCFAHGFYSIVSTKSEDSLSRRFKTYLILSTLGPLPVDIVAIQANFVRYGLRDNRGVCYQPTTAGQIDVAITLTNQFPFVIVLLACLYFSIASIRKINSIFGGFLKSWKALTILQYPAILCICWGPVIFSSLLVQLGTVRQINSNIMIFFEAMAKSQGFCNAIVYGLSKRVISSYKKKCGKAEVSTRLDTKQPSGSWRENSFCEIDSVDNRRETFLEGSLFEEAL